MDSLGLCYRAKENSFINKSQSHLYLLRQKLPLNFLTPLWKLLFTLRSLLYESEVRFKVESVAPVSTEIWQDSLLTSILVSLAWLRASLVVVYRTSHQSLKSSETGPYGASFRGRYGAFELVWKYLHKNFQDNLFQHPSGLQMR